METLACQSPATCPPCWNFRAGQCALSSGLADALGLTAPPAHAGSLWVASC